VLTPPADLSNGDLEELVRHAWGVPVASLEYCPVGFGSHHWVATDNQGLRYFVTADELSSESRRGDEVSALGLRLRRALEAVTELRACGCRFVVAPITTRAGDPLVPHGGYAIALYPFVEGRSFSSEESLSDAERDQVLMAVVALHGVPIAAIRPLETEGFGIPWLDQLDHSIPYGSEEGSSGPYAVSAVQILSANEAEIRRLIVRYGSLVAQYQSDPSPVVVTHGEVHPGNVMLTAEGWVIVDWDTVLLAPPERDLWWLAQTSDSVLQAYADATGWVPSQQLVDLYAIRWDLAEIASFAAEFRAPHDDTEDTRKALEVFRSVADRVGASEG
jgi:hypothetical protein